MDLIYNLKEIEGLIITENRTILKSNNFLKGENKWRELEKLIIQNP